MDSLSAILPAGRRRRQNYAADFKASVIAAYSQPGVSVAAVAMANQINANLVRRWIREHETSSRTSEVAAVSRPAVVPISVRAPVSGDIRCEIQRRDLVIQVTWPVSQSVSCAQWLRELLR